MTDVQKLEHAALVHGLTAYECAAVLWSPRPRVLAVWRRRQVLQHGQEAVREGRLSDRKEAGMKTKGRPTTMKKLKQFRQGDVLVDYEHPAPAGKRLPREEGAVVLAHGEVTGHKHAIESRDCSLFAVEGNRLTGEEASQAIARIGGGLVPDRALKARRPVELHHEEHAPIELPAGTARVIIQREYSPQELRSVAD